MAKRKTGFLTLPKISGEIKVRAHRKVPEDGVLKSVTVTHEPDGKYYFSLLYEVPHKTVSHEVDPDSAIGLDMSMHEFYVDSEGNHVDYGKPYHDLQGRISREQRKLSHMKKGSSNYRKQRAKIARLYAKAKHQRSDALHKLSRKLVDSYDIIGIEDLNMKAMAQSLNFGKSVGDKGWVMFTVMLAYKAKQKGKQLIKVGKFFSSSQMCHECGTLHKLTKDLSVREWTCPDCGHYHDRDENAALNIRDEAVRIYCTC
jgi:putative transposase